MHYVQQWKCLNKFLSKYALHWLSDSRAVVASYNLIQNLQLSAAQGWMLGINLCILKLYWELTENIQTDKHIAGWANCPQKPPPPNGKSPSLSLPYWSCCPCLCLFCSLHNCNDLTWLIRQRWNYMGILKWSLETHIEQVWWIDLDWCI